MPRHMKQIIFANMNVKVYRWTLTFRKVVRQHIWGEVVVLIEAFSADLFWI